MSLLIVVAIILVPIIGIAIWSEIIVRFKRGNFDRDLRSNADLDVPISRLLKIGYEGASLVLTLKKSKLHIKFSKYIREEGIYGIELEFPNTDWTKEDASKLQEHCAANGLKFRVAADGSSHAAELLYVDCEKDSDKAAGLARFILSTIFGKSTNSLFYETYTNMSQLNELVDKPGQQPGTVIEEFAQIGEAIHEHSGMPVSHMYKMYSYCLVMLVGAVALVIETILTMGEDPDWSFDVVGVAVNGSVGDVAYTAILIVGFLGFYRHMKPVKAVWDKSKDEEGTAKKWRRYAAWSAICSALVLMLYSCVEF